MSRLFRIHLASACALAALLFIGGGAAKGQSLYNQPSDFPGGNLFASQNDTSAGGFGVFSTTYDNFQLGGNAAVKDVHWQGGYFNPPGSSGVTGFTLNFYQDAGGAPGAVVQSEAVAGNANETPAGLQDNGSADPYSIYNYSAVFASPLNLSGGTPYWLSIVPDFSLPGQWGWHTGTGGDSVAVQNFAGSPSALTNDLAFGLDGAPASVPETSTLLSIGWLTAIGGMLLYRRRRVRA